MSVPQEALIASYFAVGLACGGVAYFGAVDRGPKDVVTALTVVVLWPLWAPFAASSPAPAGRGPVASRIAQALAHGDASAGTGDGPLGRSDTAILLRHVDASERRLAELDVQIDTLRSEAPAAGSRDSDSEARSRMRAVSIDRLEALRRREHTALVELAELCELLRAQRLMSRSGAAEHADLRIELWAKVQALSEIDG